MKNTYIDDPNANLIFYFATDIFIGENEPQVVNNRHYPEYRGKELSNWLLQKLKPFNLEISSQYPEVIGWAFLYTDRRQQQWKINTQAISKAADTDWKIIINPHSSSDAKSDEMEHCAILVQAIRSVLSGELSISGIDTNRLEV